jgi:hypothetical protein
MTEEDDSRFARAVFKKFEEHIEVPAELEARLLAVAAGHDWEQVGWEYDDSFFRCKRCGLKVNQRSGVPQPGERGPCKDGEP